MGDTNSVAHSFIQALRRRGIEHVFANAGTDHAPIVEALCAMQAQGTPAPAFHVIPHENLAMAMAQGYYRATGKPAVVLVHVTIGTAIGPAGTAKLIVGSLSLNRFGFSVV